jgi:hypothetical protein
MTGVDALDAEAREQITTEVDRHGRAIRRIHDTGGDAFAAELDRHLDRVSEILSDHARRTCPPG